MADTHTAVDTGAGTTVILDFLHMLCGGGKAQHTRLLDWLTHAVRHPNAPGDTALCVSGPQGCGKSLLWDIIRHLLQSLSSLPKDGDGFRWEPFARKTNHDELPTAKLEHSLAEFCFQKRDIINECVAERQRIFL